MLTAAGQIAGHGHAEGGRKSGARMPGAECVVLALGSEHESVEPSGLANGGETVETAGENLVDVGLMADVEKDLVFRSIKDGVEGHGEFDHAEIGAEMAAGF